MGKRSLRSCGDAPPLESLLTFQGDVVSKGILSDQTGVSQEPMQRVLAFEQKYPEDLSLSLIIVAVFLLRWESSGRRHDPEKNMQTDTEQDRQTYTHTPHLERCRAYQ